MDKIHAKHLEQANEAVKQARGSYRRGGSVAGSGSPAQLTNCPWCGTKIDPGKDITVETMAVDVVELTYCGDKYGRCLFSKGRSPKEGLPITVVDDELYRHPPTMLIATVDKFAQLPWNGKPRCCLGRFLSTVLATV